MARTRTLGAAVACVVSATASLALLAGGEIASARPGWLNGQAPGVPSDVDLLSARAGDPVRPVWPVGRFDAAGGSENRGAGAAPKASAPADGATLAARRPVLRADRPASGLEYEFVIGTGDNPRAGQVTSSGWLREPRWKVPDGVLKDGRRYTWTIRARERATGKVTADGPARTFAVNLRLGAQPGDGPVPTDSLGPVQVNLANGNVTTSVGTPTVGTAAGPQGATFTYNSLATAETGLRGTYYAGDSASGIGDKEAPAAVRTDAQPSFDWGAEAPWADAKPGEAFRTRWTGRLRVPDSGRYRLGGAYDGGVRIWLDGKLVVDDWKGEKGGTSPRFGDARELKAGHAYAIRMEYRRSSSDGRVALWAQRSGRGGVPVPSSWLSPAGAVLPPGWSVTPAATGPEGESALKEGTGDGGAPPSTAVGANSPAAGIKGTGLTTGAGTDQPAAGLPGPAAPAAGETGASLLKGPKHPRSDADDEAANLKAAEEAADEGLKFSYAGSSTCADDAVPEGFVCAVTVPGAGTTQLYYSNGKLARLVNPGDETTDFGYSAEHLLTAVRTPLVMDWIAVDPGRRDTSAANYQIGYAEGTARGTRLVGPEPTGFQEGKSARPGRSYDYASGTTTISTAGLGGDRTVAHDAAGRLTSDTDATGRTVRKGWTAYDQPASTLDAAGRLATTVYDETGRPVGQYGPGPKKCFAADGGLVTPAPEGCGKVPAQTTTYGDTSITTTTVGSDGVPDKTVETRLNEMGVPVAMVTDPKGLKLKTGYEYDEMFRPVAKVMPSGARQTYAYYGAAETVDNPCTDQEDPHPQAGMPKSITSPASATGSSRVEKFVYNQRGLPAAVNFGGPKWTCVDYDDRGRIHAMHVPANEWAPARTITYDTAYGGDPLTTKASEPGGDLVYKTDLLGRTVELTDVHGTRTAIGYDRAGRAVRETVTPVDHADAPQMKTVRHDDAGRVTAVALDGRTLATVSLDEGGDIERVTYANGSRLRVGRDVAGRITAKDWELAGGRSLPTEVTRARSGAVTDESAAGEDAREGGPNYRYDAAGRLVDAWVTGHHYTYDFTSAAPADCPQHTRANAGDNGNRVRLTDRTADDTTDTGYCYDDADRLLATVGEHQVKGVEYAQNGHLTGYTQDGATVEQRHDAAERYIGSSTTGEDPADVRYSSDIADHLTRRQATGGSDDSTELYSHTSVTDPDIDLVLRADKRVLTRIVALPGGVVYAKKGATYQGRSTWSYPTVRGDILAVAGEDGKQVGDLYTYGPYGEPLTRDGTVDPDHVPDNMPGDFDYGWLGQYQRGSEHAGSLFTAVLDTRLLNQPLGRFTQPVANGPFLNSYEYAAGDPVNHVSIDGYSLDVEKE